MPSIIPGYEYDIFISYRQKDNRSDKWVTKFVQALKEELDATFKENISIYFDENPYDGLGDTHDVDNSLAKKLKCLIFIPIISKTYCDPNTFAWKNEFLAFNKLAQIDEYGFKVLLPNGNTTTRVLPIRIHDLENEDRQLLENELGFLRSIDFVYKEPGVNRPLKPEDNKEDNLNKTNYRNQINKVANAIKEIITGIKEAKSSSEETVSDDTQALQPKKIQFRSELKRRNVLRASLVYILAAFVFWKVADISIGLLNLPDSTLQFVTLLLIVFFPIAILMAWLYERSPQGFIKTGSAESRENPFTDSQKKPLTSNTFILLLVATVAALFLIFPQSSKLEVASNISNSEKSIAVLPFVNMSNDPEHKYFSDGISEELINAFAKIPGLKVAGRTSSFSFRGEVGDFKKIGEQLGVNTILEGSVRKSGNQIRITAQLINVEDGFHLWTDTYTRELTDIFQIQDEITQEIMKALKVHLEEGKEIALKTKVAEISAYETYLKARQKLALRGVENLMEARNLFREAIRLDSQYAPAYSGLARTLVLIPNYSFSVRSQAELNLSREIIEKALELDPNNPEIYSVIGQQAHSFDWDWELAEKSHRKALELSPQDAEINNFAGDYYEIVHHPVLAIEIEQKAVDLNPLQAITHWDVAWVYFREKDWENALKYTKSAMSLNIIDPLFLDVMVYTFKHFNKLGEAEKIIHDETDNITSAAALYVKARLSLALDDPANAQETMEQLREFAQRGELSAYFAELYLDLGKLDDVAYWLETAYQNRDPTLVFHSMFTLPEHLPDHPALQAALNKPELNALFEIRRRNLKLRGKDSQN